MNIFCRMTCIQLINYEMGLCLTFTDTCLTKPVAPETWTTLVRTIADIPTHVSVLDTVDNVKALHEKRTEVYITILFA